MGNYQNPSFTSSLTHLKNNYCHQNSLICDIYIICYSQVLPAELQAFIPKSEFITSLTHVYCICIIY